MKDTLFNTPQETIEKFAFDEKVVEVFDDMISRSVPLYSEVQAATAKLASQYAAAGTQVYDLGCSTGTTLLNLVPTLKHQAVRFIGVDNSKAMIARSQQNLQRENLIAEVELRTEDLEETAILNASVVILNYTLQFFAPERRSALLQRIYAALNPGGVLLLTEKVRHEDAQLQQQLTELYYDFKRRNGYSELEIAQKREALENVLVPLTTEQNVSLLRDAGFTNVEAYLKWYTFVSIIAVKD